MILFFLGPVITLVFSLLGYGVIPYGPGLAISDFNLGILYLLAVSSLSTYGILLAGFFLSPSFIKIKGYNSKEFQEKLSLSQLEAKYIFFLRTFVENKLCMRSTTSRLILPRVFEILHYIFIIFWILFLYTIIFSYNMAWFNLNIFYIIFIISLTITYFFYNATSRIFVVYNSDEAYYSKNSGFSNYNFSNSNYAGTKTPNNVNFNKILLNRSYSTKAKPEISDTNNYNLPQELKALHTLYINDLTKDRLAPVTSFETDQVFASFNLSTEEEKSEFLREWGSKGGIYIIQYIYNPCIYYIGRTTLFKRRINNHLRAETNSKFHVFLSLVGKEYFSFGIIEICTKDEQGKRENFYLQKYLPLLNTTFSSSYTETSIYKSLTEKLNSLKSPVNSEKSNKPMPIYVYSVSENNNIINQDYIKYNSLAETCKMEDISYNTLLLFRDTKIPFRGKLYLTNPILEFDSILEEMNNNLKDITLRSSTAKKVWVYDAKTLNQVEGSPFLSKHHASDLLGISRKVINYFIDTKKPEGIKGTYIFSAPINDLEIKSLKEISENITLGNKVEVWAYKAENLELINGGSFSSIKEAANYFNVDYRTISRNLDTKRATKQNDMLVYLLKKEMSYDLKLELAGISNSNKFHYVRSEIWVYEVVPGGGGKIKLLPDQPFITKREAVKTLHIHNTIISNHLDTGKEYRGLLFYSACLDNNGE